MTNKTEAAGGERTDDERFAGLLFAFGGFLTSHERRWKFSGYDDAGPMVEAIREFAEQHGLPLEPCDVKGWRAALAAPVPAPEAAPGAGEGAHMAACNYCDSMGISLEPEQVFGIVDAALAATPPAAPEALQRCFACKGTRSVHGGFTCDVCSTPAEPASAAAPSGASDGVKVECPYCHDCHPECLHCGGTGEAPKVEARAGLTDVDKYCAECRRTKGADPTAKDPFEGLVELLRLHGRDDVLNALADDKKRLTIHEREAIEGIQNIAMKVARAIEAAGGTGT